MFQNDYIIVIQRYCTGNEYAMNASHTHTSFLPFSEIQGFVTIAMNCINKQSPKHTCLVGVPDKMVNE